LWSFHLIRDARSVEKTDDRGPSQGYPGRPVGTRPIREFEENQHMSIQRHLRRGLGVTLAALILLSASPALADRYEPTVAGHPLRIVAYILHPVGVMVDYLVLRPMHWIGEQEPFVTLFGHEVE
jgi:hypothetical protein